MLREPLAPARANWMKTAPKSIPSSDRAPDDRPGEEEDRQRHGNVSGLTNAIAIVSSAPATPA
jgi:hypothetical protein